MTEEAINHMENLYAWICWQPSQEHTIATLEDYALRQLNSYLTIQGVPSGVPGLIHGLVICEIADRWMNIEHPTSNIEHRSEEEDAGGAE